MRHDDHHIEDDGDAIEPIEHLGIGSLLHDLQQDVRTDEPISISVQEGTSITKHNIDEIPGISE